MLPIHHSERPNWRPSEPPDLTGIDTIQLDGEFNGLRWFAGDRPIAWVVGFGDQERVLPFGCQGGGNLDEAVVKRWMREQVRGKRIENHTTGIDIHMARVWGVDLVEQGNTFHDVSHSAALLDDTRFRVNLKALSEEFLPPDERKRDHPIDPEHLWTLPAWDLDEYGRYDVRAVRGLRRVFQPMLSAAGLDRVQALEDACIPATVEMEHNGCPLDMDLLHAWLRETEQALEDRLWRVQRQLGFPVNPGSGPDMQRVFQTLKIPIETRTKPSKKFPQGQPSFTAEVLKGLTHPIIQDLYYCSKLQDIRDKFLVPYNEMQVGGVLYPTFHQLANDTEGGERKGTRSGRYSAAHPNVTAVLGDNKMTTDYLDMPYAVRRLFRSLTGFWYCSDQAQVEFRIAVHVAAVCGIPGAEDLVERYQRDPQTDFHNIVGERLAVVRPDLTRTQIKITNFRKLYGGGATAISRSLKIPKTDAESIVRWHSRAFPPLDAVLKWAQARAEARDEVRSILGRRSRFPRDSEGHQDRTYSALNRIIQPSAADLFKTTIVEVHKERKRFGFTHRLAVHDELGGDLADPGIAPEFEAFLNEVRIPLRVPILWDGGVGSNWHDAKYAA